MLTEADRIRQAALPTAIQLGVLHNSAMVEFCHQYWTESDPRVKQDLRNKLMDQGRKLLDANFSPEKSAYLDVMVLAVTENPESELTILYDYLWDYLPDQIKIIGQALDQNRPAD